MYDSMKYDGMNEQMSAASRQMADTAAQVNRLTLDHAEQVFGLQVASLHESMNATFAFWGELAEVRDMEGFKAVMPKGMQVARENAERAVSASQDLLGRTMKTSEAIAQIAKSQVDSATANVQAETDKVVKSASKTARK